MSAKSDWYDWKLKWVQSLYETAEKAFGELEKVRLPVRIHMPILIFCIAQDAKILEDVNRRAQEIIPALQEEYDQLMKELEQEQADVADIENCDQEYLNDLKASIAEQEYVNSWFLTD